MGVGAADGQAVAAVVLDDEGAGEAVAHGEPHRGAVVDDPQLERGGVGQDEALVRGLQPHVVLDVPVVRPRHRPRHQVLPCLDRPLLAEQVAHVRVEPRGGVVDVVEEPHRAVGGAQVGVLIELQGDLEPHRPGVLGELAVARHGQRPHLGIVRFRGAGDRPEPLDLLLPGGQRVVQPQADDAGAELGGRVDRAVGEGEVAGAVLGVDDALAHHRHPGHGEPGVVEHGAQLGEPRGGEVPGAHPGARQLQRGEAGVDDRLQQRAPVRRREVVHAPAVRGRARELQHGRRDGPPVGPVGGREVGGGAQRGPLSQCATPR
jgi:hypothetical protein